MIQAPHLEYTLQKRFNRLFTDRYNLMIDEKRAQAEKEGLDYRGQEPFQRLKGQHLNAMNRLAELAARELEFQVKTPDINASRAPSEGVVVWVSTPFLATDWGTSEATVRRTIKRLRTAGYIQQKVFHGSRSQYELILAPQKILTWDLADLEYRPVVSLPEGLASGAEKAVSCEFPRSLQSKCGDNVPWSKDTISNLTTDVRNAAPPQGLSATADPGTPKDSPSTPQAEQANRSPDQGQGTAGAKISIDQRNAIREMAREKRYSAARRLENMLQLLYFQAYLIFFYAEKALWWDREIYTGARENAVDYLVENYFQGYRTEQSITARTAQVMRAIQAGAAWKKGDPKKRHHLLPKQFFDLSRKRKSRHDYAGFVGLNALLQERTASEKAKEKRFKRNKNRHDLRKWLKNYQKAPTLRKSQVLMQKVQAQMPEQVPALSDYFTNGKMP